MSAFGQLSTPGLTFDELGHVYRLDGRVLPSVSQVLKDNNLSGDFSAVDAATLARARDRGHAVHAACHYHDEGTLEMGSVDPEVMPYLTAWIRFKLERKIEVVEMERRYADFTYRFAGTLDRIVLADKERRRVLLDIKSGDATGANYQTAGYHFLANEHASTLRWVVRLHPDRPVPYSVQPFTGPRDWRIFRAALELTHERAALGRPWLESFAA